MAPTTSGRHQSIFPVLEVQPSVGVLDGEALGVEGEEEGDQEVNQQGPEVLPCSVEM